MIVFSSLLKKNKPTESALISEIIRKTKCQFYVFDRNFTLISIYRKIPKINAIV